MKKTLKTATTYLIVFIIATITLSSCISQKKTIYLQNKSMFSAGANTYENDLAAYKLQPGDFLYINVTSLDPKNMTSFEGNGRGDYQVQSEMGVYLKSYQVSDSGFIRFPVIGKVQVVGLSVSQVRDKLQSIMDEFYQLATITVKLVNFQISIMGEVNRPGTYAVHNDRLNIFQAISLGGDLTNFGNRKEVNIIRKTKTGGTEILEVNLLTDSILELPGFYLQPDDIIYVKPLKSKTFAFTSFPYSILLSTITTALVVINFFK